MLATGRAMAARLRTGATVMKYRVTLPSPPCGLNRGAPGRTRTDTPVKELDFESSASTIPPQGPDAPANRA